MSMKNPLTSAGIEPATFRFVAQHLPPCYRGPQYRTVPYYNYSTNGTFTSILPYFKLSLQEDVLGDEAGRVARNVSKKLTFYAG